jgi:hypothetical protein
MDPLVMAASPEELLDFQSVCPGNAAFQVVAQTFAFKSTTKIPLFKP